MTDRLTERQRQILDLIARHIRETGVPPTRAEIAETLGFRSANAAEDHLRALARHGAIELTRGRSRGIRLLESGGRSGAGLPGDGPGLPVIGRVAAGSPILAAEHVEDRHAVDPGLFRPRADYLLRVRGSSMRDAGILDRDLLAVHATREAENGQIVVARLGDEVTVKRFRRHARWAHRVYLLPENPDCQPIAVDLREEDLTIEGIAVGLLRLGLAANPASRFSERFAPMIDVPMSEPVTAYVALGANLQDPERQVRTAFEDLSRLPETALVACSALYRTAPVGPQGQPDYINAVACLATRLAPRALLEALQGIERAHGRRRDGTRWGPRPLDLDILLYGDRQIAQSGLQVPHPEMARRAFVLVPLADLAPAGLPIPGSGTLGELLARCTREGIAPLDPG